MPPKFVPRQRKHKAIARQKASSTPTPVVDDANALEIMPAEQREHEEKKKSMKQELLQDSRGHMSKKKKKRLDKYIDTKLKKDDNLVLLKKLASQQHKVDTSLFQSSKKLGSGSDSKKEALRRALIERKAGIDVEKNEKLLFEERPRRDYEPESSDSDADEPESLSQPIRSNAPTPEAMSQKQPKRSSGSLGATEPPAPAATTLQYTRGSGLKRPLDVDESGKPIIQVRKRRKGTGKPIVTEEDVEWDGFSSDEHADDAEGSTSTDSEGSRSSPEVDDASGPDGSEDEDSDEDSESDSDTSLDENTKAAKKEKTSAFKAWATQQRNEAVGFVPSNNLSSAIPPKPSNFEPRAPEHDPLPAELETKTATDATRTAFGVTVERSSEMQESRLQLPIVAEEQKIMEAIHNNDVVVVWGATGSGKTTQVPQFLYEAGYGSPEGPTPGMIGVTQPRRVAAVSMSKRVSDELGDHGSRVAYQIRFDTTTSAKSAIKFMTDGVLLREITQDFVLTKYSAIVIDEAHERSVNTDILVGMLSRIVDLRAEMAKQDPEVKPLKLIVMSATLRISDFTENARLFRGQPPPLIKAEGRQYTVTNHFARRTERDYGEEMFRKISRGHRKLPKGGMLVFLTGQNEIAQLAKQLKQAFSSTQGHDANVGKIQISAAETPLETEDMELGAKEQEFEDNDGSDSEDSVIFENDDDDEDFKIDEEKPEDTVMNVHVLPLYSQLPTNQQLRVFDPPPEGSRLIVLATNVCRTNLHLSFEDEY
jgi:ATP-dependent RNA helicase DHX37/DHR1